MYLKTAPTIFLLLAILSLIVIVGNVNAAGQTSETFRIVADVYEQSSPILTQSSAKYQTSISVAQLSLSTPSVSGTTFKLASGYQATTEGFDSDYDGIPDISDSDSDGDGIPDVSDSLPYDSDNDGMNNVGHDSDDDNDELADVDEWLFGTSLINPDTDDDTQNDYAEWVAGTSGTNPNNFFHISSFSRNGNNLNITWDGVAGRQYSITYTNTLAGTGEWTSLWTTNATETGEIIYTQESPDHQKSFFRINVSKP